MEDYYCHDCRSFILAIQTGTSEFRCLSCDGDDVDVIDVSEAEEGYLKVDLTPMLDSAVSRQSASTADL